MKKLSNEEIKKYRNIYINGLMDSVSISENLGISYRYALAILHNKTHIDDTYSKELERLNLREKKPFILPINKKYTDTIRSFLRNYSVSIEERVLCLKENLCELTYEEQTVIFITDEDDKDRYLLVIENESGFLLPKNKYKIEVVIEKDCQFFSRFIYKKEDAEVVKIIREYKKYWISENGKVISLFRGKILSSRLNENGYEMVSLSSNGYDLKTHLVHRLVAGEFVPNLKNKPQVNHINGDKSFNHYSNLEWCTSKENIIHAYQTGLATSNQGENSHRSKLSNEQAREIRKYFHDKTHTVPILADKYQISIRTVWDILMYKKYKNASDETTLPRYVPRKK